MIPSSKRSLRYNVSLLHSLHNFSWFISKLFNEQKKKKKDKTGTIRSSGIFLLVSTLTINLITFYCNHFITPMTQEFKMWFNPCVSLSQHYPFLTVFDLLYNLFYYSYPFMIVQYMNMNHWCGSCNHGTWKDGHEYVLIIPLSIDQSFYLKFFNK